MLEESLGYFTSVHREYTLHGLLLTRKKSLLKSLKMTAGLPLPYS